ncbi:MAG: molybdate ABC transporter substrate-binding protein [Pseudomonadota bacterium]
MRAALASLLVLVSLNATAEPMIFAAASTSEATNAAIAASGIKALTSYGASGTIARQIEQGAPADLFISANPRWMDHLIDQRLVNKGDVVTLMSNALVLIGKSGEPTVNLDRSLADNLEGEMLAMADPALAPVGRYGQQALESLDLWEATKAALIPTRNTLATVKAVQSGDVRFGLVYASDVRDVEGIKVVAAIPADSHAPIRYLAAPLTTGDDGTGGKQLLQFLLSEDGQDILKNHGFVTLESGAL